MAGTVLLQVGQSLQQRVPTAEIKQICWHYIITTQKKGFYNGVMGLDLLAA